MIAVYCHPVRETVCAPVDRWSSGKGFCDDEECVSVDDIANRLQDCLFSFSVLSFHGSAMRSVDALARLDQLEMFFGLSRGLVIKIGHICCAWGKHEGIYSPYRFL